MALIRILFVLSFLLYVPLVSVIVLYFNKTIGYITASLIIVIYSALINIYNVYKKMVFDRKISQYIIAFFYHSFNYIMLSIVLILLHYNYVSYAYIVFLALFLLLCIFSILHIIMADYVYKNVTDTFSLFVKKDYISGNLISLTINAVFFIFGLFFVNSQETTLYIYFMIYTAYNIIKLFIKFFKVTLKFILFMIDDSGEAKEFKKIYDTAMNNLYKKSILESSKKSLQIFSYISIIITISTIVLYILYYAGILNILYTIIIVDIFLVVINILRTRIVLYTSIINDRDFIYFVIKIIFFTVAIYFYNYGDINTAYNILLYSMGISMLLYKYYDITKKSYIKRLIDKLNSLNLPEDKYIMMENQLKSRVKKYYSGFIINVVSLVLGIIFINKSAIILPVYITIELILYLLTLTAFTIMLFKARKYA